MILIPWAPRRMASCIARFMARRNVMHFSELLGDRQVGDGLASSSGLRTSSMLTWTARQRSSADRAWRPRCPRPSCQWRRPGEGATQIDAGVLGRTLDDPRDPPKRAQALLRVQDADEVPVQHHRVDPLLLLANQREPQSRVTAGGTSGMDFLTHVTPRLANGQLNVAGGLQDAVATTLRTRKTRGRSSPSS